MARRRNPSLASLVAQLVLLIVAAAVFSPFLRDALVRIGLVTIAAAGVTIAFRLSGPVPKPSTTEPILDRVRALD